MSYLKRNTDLLIKPYPLLTLNHLTTPVTLLAAKKIKFILDFTEFDKKNVVSPIKIYIQNGMATYKDGRNKVVL